MTASSLASVSTCTVAANITASGETCLTITAITCNIPTLLVPDWLRVALRPQQTSIGRVCGAGMAAGIVVDVSVRVLPVLPMPTAAGVLRGLCTAQYRDTAESGRDTMTLDFSLPEIIVVPPTVSVPSDARLPIDGRSAVAESPDGRASMQLVTSGRQNVTFNYR